MGDLPVRQARAGGRGARRALRAAPDPAMLPALKRGLPDCAPMSPEEVERLDAASMAILEEVGVVFRDPIALADWKRAGADVRGERVHLDRGLVRALIATIPACWTYRARNPERSLPFGGRHSIFVPMTGAPFLRDLEDVRRWPTLADLNMFHKLAHMSPALHSTAHHIVEPMAPRAASAALWCRRCARGARAWRWPTASWRGSRPTCICRATCARRLTRTGCRARWRRGWAGSTSW
ncbi:trimethylamine methyltransferase MttB-like protein (plasmid) [Cereibacter sphaeroides KD131]|nr:trimethylamine methyltransferase MttB-like protein [Cereibacter sphaeroides KD131]